MSKLDDQFHEEKDSVWRNPAFWVFGAIAAITIGLFACVPDQAKANEMPPVPLAASTVHKLSVGGKIMGGIDATAGNCSAVAISPKYVVTAAHCVQDWLDNLIRVDKVNWTMGEMKTLSSQFLYLNRVRTLRSLDVAVMELADPDMEFESYSKICTEYKPVIGDELMAITYPRADKKMVTEGRFGELASLSQLGLKGPFWKTSVPVVGGSSGGGLFREQDDGSLCLVGTTSAAYPLSFETYFAPIESINRITIGLLGDKADPYRETTSLWRYPL